MYIRLFVPNASTQLVQVVCGAFPFYLLCLSAVVGIVFIGIKYHGFCHFSVRHFFLGLLESSKI